MVGVLVSVPVVIVVFIVSVIVIVVVVGVLVIVIVIVVVLLIFSVVVLVRVAVSFRVLCKVSRTVWCFCVGYVFESLEVHQYIVYASRFLVWTCLVCRCLVQ